MSNQQQQGKSENDLEAETCATLSSCILRLRNIAQTRKGENFGGMGKDERVVASRIQKFPGSVDGLVPLLADPNIEVAQLAAYVLRDVETIDAGYLPQIILGLDRDLDWLAPALGRIATADAAKEAVARLLASDDGPENQEGYAVELSGLRAIPFIVAAARCDGGCKTQSDHYYLGYALTEMGAIAAQAVPSLVALIDDPTTPKPVDRGALTMIGAVGKYAQPWQHDITALATKQPEYTRAVEHVLVKIRAERAGEIMARRLRNAPDMVMLRDTAELGRAGRSAAPAVLELLNHANPELRVAAVTALGFIGDSTASAPLVFALNNPTDVRLNWAAAVALGRLPVTDQAAALAQVAREHWHPAVRKAASDALVVSREATPSNEELEAMPAEFFRSIGDELLNCDNPAAGVVEQPQSLKLYAHRDSKKIAELQYSAIIESFGPRENTKPNSAGVIVVTSENMVRHEREVLQTPTVALRVEGGWLVGSDRGEWGGELIWLGDTGDRQKILDGNVEDIHRLANRVVVVSGLAHL